MRPLVEVFPQPESVPSRVANTPKSSPDGPQVSRQWDAAAPQGLPKSEWRTKEALERMASRPPASQPRFLSSGLAPTGPFFRAKLLQEFSPKSLLLPNNAGPQVDSRQKIKRKSYAKHNKSLEQELNLSDSQQQGCSTAYSTPFHLSRLQRIHPRVCLKCNEQACQRAFPQTGDHSQIWYSTEVYSYAT